MQDFAQEPVDRTLPENSGILHSQLSKNLSLQKPQAFVDDLPETVGRNPTEIENPDIGDSFVVMIK